MTLGWWEIYNFTQHSIVIPWQESILLSPVNTVYHSIIVHMFKWRFTYNKQFIHLDISVQWYDTWGWSSAKYGLFWQLMNSKLAEIFELKLQWFMIKNASISCRVVNAKFELGWSTRLIDPAEEVLCGLLWYYVWLDKLSTNILVTNICRILLSRNEIWTDGGVKCHFAQISA